MKAKKSKLHICSCIKSFFLYNSRYGNFYQIDHSSDSPPFLKSTWLNNGKIWLYNVNMVCYFWVWPISFCNVVYIHLFIGNLGNFLDFHFIKFDVWHLFLSLNTTYIRQKILWQRSDLWTPKYFHRCNGLRESNSLILFYFIIFYMLCTPFIRN